MLSDPQGVAISLLMAGAVLGFFSFKMRFDRTNAHGVQEYRSAIGAVAGAFMQRVLRGISVLCLLGGGLLLFGILTRTH